MLSGLPLTGADTMAIALCGAPVSVRLLQRRLLACHDHVYRQRCSSGPHSVRWEPVCSQDGRRDGIPYGHPPLPAIADPSDSWSALLHLQPPQHLGRPRRDGQDRPRRAADAQAYHRLRGHLRLARPAQSLARPQALQGRPRIGRVQRSGFVCGELCKSPVEAAGPRRALV
jgi:hypothetical protein